MSMPERDDRPKPKSGVRWPAGDYRSKPGPLRGPGPEGDARPCASCRATGIYPHEECLRALEEMADGF